jgi:hypothetical protein
MGDQRASDTCRLSSRQAAAGPVLSVAHVLCRIVTRSLCWALGRASHGARGPHLVPLFTQLEDMKNVELLIWTMNQDDPVRVDPELKAKVDALNNPTNLQTSDRPDPHDPVFLNTTNTSAVHIRHGRASGSVFCSSRALPPAVPSHHGLPAAVLHS